MNFFKKWFNKNKSPDIKHIEIQNLDNQKILLNIKQFDDVWIKIDENIFEGWVTEKIGNVINIVYTDNNSKLEDATFIINRPLDRISIEQNGKILFLNKPK